MVVCFRFHTQVTRLLNECEKHTLAGRAPFLAGVKRDLRKHVELSEAARLWWTQLDVVPASVLHAETLAANFRAVPFTPAAAAGAEASTHATGAAAGAAAGALGLLMHRTQLAPALDFLLTCFRGQARCAPLPNSFARAAARLPRVCMSCVWVRLVLYTRLCTGLAAKRC